MHHWPLHSYQLAAILFSSLELNLWVLSSPRESYFFVHNLILNGNLRVYIYIKIELPFCSFSLLPVARL